MGGSQPEISERRATSLEDQATTTLSDDEVAAVNAKGPPPAPDYSDLACWAAYPGQPSPAELAPDGETLLPNAERPADCFFVHPTGCFSNDYWNQHLDDPQANERTDAMVGGQASAFSRACRIFAPRYRQFSASQVYAGDRIPADIRANNGEVAYGDVLAAFHHFIKHCNENRPFILAGHSQGSGHLQRLIAEELDAHWEQYGERFIAAYVIGGGYPEERVAQLEHLELSQTATDSAVVIGWDTSSAAGGGAHWAAGGGKIVGTNPYTWRTGGDNEPVSGVASLGILNLRADFPNGRVPGSGNGVGPIGSFPLNDLPMGLVCTSLGAPTTPEETFSFPPGGLTAQVHPDTGVLMIPDPPAHGSTMESWHEFFGEPQAGGSYHVMDYAYFWANIRHNAAVRVAAFVARGGSRSKI